jgi:dTDP-4-dehydrorhamnose 3,5-epimerase
LVVNTLTADAVNKKELTIFGGGQYRPLLHVRDAACAISQNLTTKHKGVFNLQSKNIRIDALAGGVAKRVPGTKIMTREMDTPDTRNYRVSSLKAVRAFGFKPKLKVEDGIQEIRRLFEEKRIKNPGICKYTNVDHLATTNNHGGKNLPKIIDGDLSVDDRGEVAFVNDFDFAGVKRFYSVRNHKAGLVRAWHAHKKEAKYVVVTEGAAIVGVVPVDNWERPAKKAQVEKFVMSSAKPRVLYIPPGYANGFMALTPDTQVTFYSTSTLPESKGDDFRYDARYWDIWEIEER